MPGRPRKSEVIRTTEANKRPPGQSGTESSAMGRPSEIERLHSVIAQLLHTAAHDPLTGLPTRSLLLDRLETELARRTAGNAQIAVLFIDLDNFKLVNDSLGHGSGDQALSEMARRIVGCTGNGDTASRFGGDEMVVLHPYDIAGSGVAMGRRILAALGAVRNLVGIR